MELAGDEKRIQALFSDSALQDQCTTPTFAELWSGARMKKPAAARSLGKPLLAVSAALLMAALAWWGAREWYRSARSLPQQVVNVSPERVSPPTSHVVQQKNHVAADLSVKSLPDRHNKRRTHQPERSAITEAALLSRWQSPTQFFIKSPATVDFNSLPQLNQSAEELKQFLSRNTELTKESNQ